MEAFADGLEEDIASGLSRFSYLFVVSRKSTQRYRGEAIDVRQAAEELGARYVMEGGIRRAGSRIRIGMNLIDAATGTHLWSETYDRDLGPRTSSSCRTRSPVGSWPPWPTAMEFWCTRSRPVSRARPKRSMYLGNGLSGSSGIASGPRPAEHSRLRDSLEEAVDRDPNVADAWACLHRSTSTSMVLDSTLARMPRTGLLRPPSVPSISIERTSSGTRCWRRASFSSET